MRQEGCGYDVTIMKMEAVGMAEEEDLRDLEAVEMVKETGDSGMIIGEILCLFLLQKLPILLAPLSFSPLNG